MTNSKLIAAQGLDAGQAGYLEFLIRIGAIHDARMVQEM